MAQQPEQRIVKCIKLGRELPGLKEPPFDNAFGQRIYENVSEDAWLMWVEHLKMVLNEYRLNLANREDQMKVRKYMEDFFFGEGAGQNVPAPPPDYVPPTQK